jgi:hypothetical protein
MKSNFSPVPSTQCCFLRSFAVSLSSFFFIANAFAQTAPPTLPSVTSGTLQLWLKADAGVVVNGGGQVSQWQDQSRNANHASQSNTNNQPLLVYPPGLGGKAALRFNGIQDGVNGDYLYGMGDVGVPNAMTAFAVQNVFTDTNAANVVWLVGVPGAVYGASRCDGILDKQLDFSTWAYDSTAPWVVPTNTYRLCTDRVNTNLNTVEIFDTAAGSATNFSLAMPGNVTTPAPGYYVGGINPSLLNVSPDNLAGDIAEVIIFKGYLSEADRLAVQNYLEQKYNLTSNLTPPPPGQPALPPVSSGTLHLWLKADTGVVTNASGQVSQWQDQSGNANHAIQNNANNQPSLVSAAGLGGRSAIRFNGIQDNINGDFLHGSGDVGVPNALTTFAVYNSFSNEPNGNEIFVIGQPPAYGSIRADTIYEDKMYFSTWAYDYPFPFLGPTNTYRIWTTELNTNLSSVQVYDNSATTETNFSAAVANTVTPAPGYYVGGLDPTVQNTGSSRCFDGDIVEVICYSGQLSDEDRLAILGYLQQKYYAAPCVPSPATATATVANGGIVAVTVTEGGCGYTNTPVISFAGGGGTGATATAVVSNGVVVGITVTDPGTGYTLAPTVDINSSGSSPCIPHAAEATAEVVNGFVVGATVTDGGCGYTNTPVVFFAGGGGTGATATAVVSNGVVVGITITSAGSGYTNTPAVDIYASIANAQIGLIQAVIPTFSNLAVGLNYQLQVSSGLDAWTNFGSSFVATNSSLVYPQYFSVTNWDQLFFRLLGSP